jgi:hypothetical protein
MRKTVIVILCFTAVLIYACQHEVLTISKAPSNLVYSTDSISVISGTAGSSVAPSLDNNGGTVTYTITNTANQGISINSKTGVISWISTVAIGTYNLIITATNSSGIANAGYILVVTAPQVAAPTNLVYSPSSSTVVSGTAGSSATPTINAGTGGTPSYSLTGTIPSGITISSSTGVISWAKTVAVGNYSLSVTAANASGSISATYSLTVTSTATVTAPSSFTYSPATTTVTQGTAGSSVAPSINNGLGTIAYSLTGTIPTGISINSATGVISWSNAVASGTYTLTISAANSAGKVTTTYSLAVNAASTSSVSFSTQILPVFKTSCSGCHSYMSSYSGISSHTSGCNSIQNKIGTTYCSGSRMPQGGSPLSASFIALFNTWISQGMLNN